ncbi:hypothetical protein [Falsiroseomonas selenitidurans]|uniref:Uncharacterized protein n=1 Tax=Falsiroseomonas selenitidurans TaxID=2716335 RepID=A0ABX1EF79_9PROT|nr:hypothetical protein [Falsiroseomonas selenitidurans]NKC34177.1 hypothetical protein [Falsiroseomonas selenitidurans]
MAKTQELTEGQRAYEARRAAKAGMSLEKWLAEKDRMKRAEDAAAAKAATEDKKAPEAKGWLGRMLDRAHKPLK